MLSIIVATDRNGVIAKNGELPWNCPEDLKFFKEKTIHRPIIMGRNTFESLNLKPLPKRFNIVITKNPDVWNKKHESDILKFVSHPCTAILASLVLPDKYDSPTDEAFVIGGGEIYKWFLNSESVGRIYLNRMKTTVEYGEQDSIVKFPKVDQATWEQRSRKEYPEFAAKTYEKKVKNKQ